MRTSTFTESQTINILTGAVTGLPLETVSRQDGISKAFLL